MRIHAGNHARIQQMVPKKPQGRLCHLQFAERPKIELIKIEERLYL